MRYFIILLLLGAEPPADPIECPPEALKLYGTKVQPFFANACAACHSTGKSGSFTLRRSAPGVSIPPETSQANLAAALRQVDRAHPEKSPLLLKTITAHGGQQRPALKDANAPAYKHLQEWVRLVSRDAQRSANSRDAERSAEMPNDPFDPAIFNRGG